MISVCISKESDFAKETAESILGRVKFYTKKDKPSFHLALRRLKLAMTLNPIIHGPITTFIPWLSHKN